MKRIVALGVSLLAWGVLSVVPVHAQVCSNASLKGAYGFHETPAPIPPGLFDGIGLLTFDGKGNLKYDYLLWDYYGGQGSDIEDWTYSVSSNCKFTMTNAAGQSYAGVIVLDGRELRYITVPATEGGGVVKGGGAKSAHSELTCSPL